MHQVTPFQFQDNSVRTITNDQNEIWFVAKDVCDTLELENVTKALIRVPKKHKGVNSIQTLGGTQKVNMVSEPGLYRLILRSDKPNAEPFMEWITSEVLPAIRKTGTYNLPDCQADKTIDIRHHRNPVSPSGLDIRYTLDLTKVMMKPSEKSLALLERVTGLDLSDLIDDMVLPPSTSTTATAQIFIAKHCHEAEPDNRIPLAVIFTAYTEWFKENQYPATQMAHNRQFSALLVDAGYGKRMVGGSVKIYGIALSSMEVA